MKTSITLLCAFFVSSLAAAQTPEAGRQIYVARCAGCHGTTANGGELGPDITSRVPARTDQELTTLLHQGLPMAGMPAFAGLSDADVRNVIAFLRTIKPRDGAEPVRTKVILTTGATLEGVMLNQGVTDLQVLGDDRKLHLLRRSTATGANYRPVTSQSDWPSYNG